MRKGEVRRSKLYYLRDLRGKAAKIRERRGGADLETIYSDSPSENSAIDSNQSTPAEVIDTAEVAPESEEKTQA